MSRGFRPTRQRYGVIFVLSDLIGQNPDVVDDALRSIGGWPGESHIIADLSSVGANAGAGRGSGIGRCRNWRRPQDVADPAGFGALYGIIFNAYLRVAERACLSRQVDYLAWRTDGAFEDLFLELLSRGSVLAGAVELGGCHAVSSSPVLVVGAPWDHPGGALFLQAAFPLRGRQYHGVLPLARSGTSGECLAAPGEALGFLCVDDSALRRADFRVGALVAISLFRRGAQRRHSPGPLRLDGCGR